MTLLLLYAALVLGVSFLCSILEAALLSTTPSFVAAQARADTVTGKRLQYYKNDIDRPLSAILSLNTIAHTVGAVGVGAQAAVVFGDGLVGVTSAVLTFLVLVLSEIIPKTLGAVYWRQLSPVMVRILPPIIWSMWPLVQLSRGLSRLLSSGKDEASVRRDELTALADLGTKEGVFEVEESRILHNLLRFSSLRVRDVMTPRTVVVTLPQDQTVGEVIESHDSFRFSRLPVHAETREDITGFVLKDDILLQAAQEHYDEPLEALRRDLEVVPESLPLLDLFERLLDQSAHIALVVDEYGGMAGIVTLEDVVETLLGLEIVDEVDSVDDMQKLAREQWRKRAERLGIVPEEMEAESSDLLRRDSSGEPSTREEPAEASTTAAGTSSPASSSPSDRS